MSPGFLWARMACFERPDEASSKVQDFCRCAQSHLLASRLCAYDVLLCILQAPWFGWTGFTQVSHIKTDPAPRSMYVLLCTHLAIGVATLPPSARRAWLLVGQCVPRRAFGCHSEKTSNPVDGAVEWTRDELSFALGLSSIPLI